MNPYELVTTLKIINMASNKALECMALAELNEGRAHQPQIATPENPNPPNAAQYLEGARLLRLQAGGEVDMVINASLSLIPKPVPGTDDKIGGRLAALNGKAEGEP